MSTFSTYQAKGIREDLSDTIFDISPAETPLTSMAGKRKAKNTYFEWQTDKLDAATANNAKVEGADTAVSTTNPTTRVGNYTQIMDKDFKISGSLEATDRAGRKAEWSYQLAKKGKELKRDMEATFTSANVAVAGSDAVARKTAGLDSWLKSNTNNGNGTTGDYTYTTTPITARTAATTGAIRTYTEALFKGVNTKVWESGGEGDVLMVGAFQKEKASSFQGIAEIRHNVNSPRQAAIIGAADIIVTDFGNVSVVPNRFMPKDLSYQIDPDYISVATFRPFHTEKLAKTGDAERHVLRVEAGLQVDNEAAHGVTRDLTVA